MSRVSVKEVVQLTGINEHTLRAWERRYQAIQPLRQENGRRTYSEGDIKRLQLLSELVSLGYAISKISSLQNEELARLVEEPYLAEVNQLKNSKPSEAKYFLDELEAISVSVGRYNIDYIQAQMKNARFALSGIDFAMLFAAPVAQWIGELWSLEKISVAQEHLLTSILRGQLYSCLADIDYGAGDNRKGTIMLATPEGDYHELGILIAAVIIRSFGYMPMYIGPNMPAESLADLASSWQVDVILLGMTNMPETMLKQKRVDYIQAIDQALDPQVSLWIGGKVPDLKNCVSCARKVEAFKNFETLKKRLLEF